MSQTFGNVPWDAIGDFFAVLGIACTVIVILWMVVEKFIGRGRR